MPEGKGVTDFRLGVAVSNGRFCKSTANPSQWTPWAKKGGGWSGWAFASPNDWDCILVGLEAKVVTYGSITVKTQAEGTNPPPPAKWILLNSAGGVVAQESDGSISEQYDNLPEGPYQLDYTYVPRTIKYQGKTYVLDDSKCVTNGVGGICPGTTANLGTLDNSCSTGSYNPHTACVNNSCQVVEGCGPSDCSDCSSPRGDRQPPTRSEVRAPWGISTVSAAEIIDDGPSYNVCQAGYCESVSGSGTDECQESSTCPGYVPPSTGGPPPAPPIPELTFTIHYKLQGASNNSSVDLKVAVNSMPASDGPITVSKDGATGTVSWVLKNVTNCAVTYDGGNSISVPPSLFTGSRPISDFTPAMTVGTHRFDVQCTDLLGGPARDRVTVNVTDGNDLELSCTTPEPTAPRNALVTFTGHNGTGGYTWSSSRGTGSGPTYQVSFPDVGQKTITVKSGGISKTCNVTIIDSGQNLACSGPASASRQTDVTFNAISSGLSGDHTWAGGGTPNGSGVTGASFTTQFYWPGRKTVTTTRSGLADSCQIEILPSGVTPTSTVANCTINVASNAPTNWLIGGPTPNGQFIHSPSYADLVQGGTHVTDDSGAALPFGTYSISVPASVNGWSNPAVIPVSSGNCSASNPVLNFNINYANQPTTLTCSPPNQSTFAGDGSAEASFNAFGGTGNYAWSAPGGSPNNGTGQSFTTSYSLPATRTVTLSDGVSTSTCKVAVFGTPPPQCSGPASLQVGQNGTFFASGGKGGPYIWTTSAQGWGAAVPNWGQGPSFTTRFTAMGGGQKVVTVWDGAGNDNCLVTLTGGNQHTECVNQACVTVGGPGVDRCGTNADCGGGPGSPPFQGVCDSAQRACVNRAGTGGPTCSSDPNCIGTTDSHLECQNNSCVIVNGAGADTCGTIGDECVGGPVGPPGPGAAVCTFTANPKIVSRGDASQLTWICNGGGIAACTITDASTGSVITTGGPSGEVSVSPLRTTPYSINCGSGAFTDSVTVRVLSIFEVPPR